MDYDVGVLGLSSPPAAAVRTQYRPAVQVRNNGIHDALASGYIRIYAAGLLIFETEVYSGTLAPGATSLAQGVDYWTPPSEGAYIINGYVSTPLDQYEPNNNLAPVTIHVSGEEPPPPPVVTAHASQHEEGGTDEVSIDGLQGRTADPQTPLGHQLSHRAGAADELILTGLHGVLADGQPTGPHHSEHEQAGADEINLDGLHGQVADPQIPTEHHESHQSTGEDQMNVGGLNGLLNEPQRLGGTDLPVPPPIALGNAETKTILEYTAPAGSLSAGDQFRLHAKLIFYDPNPAAFSVKTYLKSGSGSDDLVLTLEPSLPNPSDADFYYCDVDVSMDIMDGLCASIGHMDCGQEDGQVLRTWDLETAHGITITEPLKMKLEITTPADVGAGASVKHASLIKFHELDE